MTGRTPAEAVRQHIDLLQRYLSCVTPAVLHVQGRYRTGGTSQWLLLANGQPVRLGSRGVYSLTLKQQYQIVALQEQPSPHHALTEIVAYSYEIGEWEGRAILSYHLHPDPMQRVRHPHLHLEAGARIGRTDLYKTHLPTGLVSVRDIVRLTIEELGVEPRRPDWRHVLDLPSFG